MLCPLNGISAESEIGSPNFRFHFHSHSAEFLCFVILHLFPKLFTIVAQALININ